MKRDWLHIASPAPQAQRRRVLLTTPHHIAVLAAHHGIDYGTVIETAHYGHVLTCIKKAVFQAVRDIVTENSTPTDDTKGETP